MRAVEHFVELYFSIGFTNKEILNLLAHQHHIVISIRTLKRICKKMHLFRRKNQSHKCMTFSFFLSVALILRRIKYTSHININTHQSVTLCSFIE